MKTIGQILKDARIKKKYSLEKLENTTKIKRAFIDSIEKEKWNLLPPFPTVLGFVKSIASTLDLDDRGTSAVLKRDYPPKKLRISPKPDVSSKFAWSPKLTFFAGLAVAAISLLGYLIFQFVRFNSPPRLTVESPKEGQEIKGATVPVFGSTDLDAKVTVNNQPVLVDTDGKFSVSLEVLQQTSEVVVKAVGRSGKETVISRKIKVQ